LSRKKKRKKKQAKSRRPSRVAGTPVRLAWWVLLGIVLISVLAYAHTSSFEFVHDDEDQVLKNPVIRDWGNAGSIFMTDVWRFKDPSRSSNYYRPVHMLLHMLGYQISGLQPSGYHWINIVLHSGAALLVALIGFLLAGRVWIAAAAGLLFALHPVHTESVTWVAGVTDLACALFYFGALYFYIVDIRAPRRRTMILASVCFFLALLSKEMAFTFPLAALLLDWSERRTLRWSRYTLLAGFFAVYLLMRVQALGRLHVEQVSLDLGLFQHGLTILNLLAQYLLKMFVPHDIHAFHVFDPTTSVFTWSFGGTFLILALFAASLWYFRKDRLIQFLLVLCPLSLLPALNISGLGENVFADRYLYIPTLGSSLLIPILALRIYERVGIARKRFVAAAAAAAFCSLLIFYGWSIRSISTMWRDPFTLYSETLIRTPTSTAMANNLGALHFYRGDYPKARELFRRSLDNWESHFIKNDYNRFDSYSGLGGVALHQGDIPQAIKYFEKAREILPGEVSVVQNLGVAYATAGEFDEAIRLYREALQINPSSEATYNNLAALYLKTNRYRETIGQADEALRIRPRFTDALIHKARAHAALGELDLARQAYGRARQSDPTRAGQIDQELEALQPPSPPPDS
jgi:tetratricopeptide (TPR) repeat protein